MPNPNPLTATELARGDATLIAALTDALAAIDQEELFTAARDALVASVWDQTSKINGVDAETVLSSVNPPEGGAVILIADRDGAVRVLQAFDPTSGSMEAIAPDAAQDLADAMADEMAADTARSEVLAQLSPDLLPTPAAPIPEPVPVDARDQKIAALQEQLVGARADLDWVINYVVTGEA